MPKQKTQRAARKRFKITGTGRVLRRHAMRSHLLGKKSSRRKRRLRRADPVAPTDLKTVKKLLGRG